MNRTQFNKSVVPGLFSFAVSSYRPKSGEEMWRQLVDAVRPSRRAYEEAAYYGALGLIPIKAEGVGVTYSDMSQGPNLKLSLLKSNLKVIKKAISEKVLRVFTRMIPRKDYCVA